MAIGSGRGRRGGEDSVTAARGESVGEEGGEEDATPRALFKDEPEEDLYREFCMVVDA